MARSITLRAILGAATLIIAISLAATWNSTYMLHKWLINYYTFIRGLIQKSCHTSWKSLKTWQDNIENVQTYDPLYLQ